MNFHGKTKGTVLEGKIAQLAVGEAMGGMMYYALARIAEHYGYADVAKEFIELGNQETNHAGFYAMLNGKYPLDKDAFWKLVKGLSKAESKGEANLGKLAAQLDELGLGEAAEQVRVFGAQETHHGEATMSLIKKYAPEHAESAPAGNKKIYVCPVCGYEHEGELDAEPSDWKCPICGVGKAAFKPMA